MRPLLRDRLAKRNEPENQYCGFVPFKLDMKMLKTLRNEGYVVVVVE